MRTVRKSIYNIVFGLAGQFITIGIGLLLPRLFLLSYGSEVNGFLSSLNQVFAYLALLEMGVGAATIQALYGPLAKNEKQTISGIVSATNLFYKKTARIYLIGVIILSAIYPLVIQSEISRLLQSAIILVIGGSGVISYYSQAKYKLLLKAEGKQYVISNVTTIIHLVTSGVKILLIACGVSVIWLQVAQLVLTLCQTVYYTTYVRKNYEWLDIKAQPDNTAINQRKFVLLHEISWMVFNHTDVFLLTALLQDLKVVSVYVLYNTFMEMVATMIQNVNNGFVYNLGQVYNSNEKKHKPMFDCYETYYMAFSFALYCITYLFLMPFMKLYTAGIEDINYLLPFMPILFVSYKTLVSGRAACGSLIAYAGHFRQTQWHASVEALLNIVLSCFFILYLQSRIKLGIYGALLGTIGALLFRGNMMVWYANKKILCRSLWKTYGKFVLNVCLLMGVSLCFGQLALVLDSYWKLISCAVICSAVILLIFLGINSICNPKSFLYIWEQLPLLKRRRIDTNEGNTNK